MTPLARDNVVLLGLLAAQGLDHRIRLPIGRRRVPVALGVGAVGLASFAGPLLTHAVPSRARFSDRYEEADRLWWALLFTSAVCGLVVTVGGAQATRPRNRDDA